MNFALSFIVYALCILLFYVGRSSEAQPGVDGFDTKSHGKESAGELLNYVRKQGKPRAPAAPETLPSAATTLSSTDGRHKLNPKEPLFQSPTTMKHNRWPVSTSLPALETKPAISTRPIVIDVMKPTTETDDHFLLINSTDAVKTFTEIPSNESSNSQASLYWFFNATELTIIDNSTQQAWLFGNKTGKKDRQDCGSGLSCPLIVLIVLYGLLVFCCASYAVFRLCRYVKRERNYQQAFVQLLAAHNRYCDCSLKENNYAPISPAHQTDLETKHSNTSSDVDSVTMSSNSDCGSGLSSGSLVDSLKLILNNNGTLHGSFSPMPTDHHCKMNFAATTNDARVSQNCEFMDPRLTRSPEVIYGICNTCYRELESRRLILSE